MKKIRPFLWFNDQAEEATKLYVSLFKNSKIVDVTRSDGNVRSVTFELEGQEFIAFNGGPHFAFTPAISLYVDCKTQAEVDELWARLTEGGAESQCGWLVDKYGLSWQIIPSVLVEMLTDEDDEKSERVLQAMLQMGKIDIKRIEQAYNGA
jgi:predicted 3-demethylubiquinone-9 3-methyltransferase (glyoxalase superfamily)